MRHPTARRNYRLQHMNKWQRRRYFDKVMRTIYIPHLRNLLHGREDNP